MRTRFQSQCQTAGVPILRQRRLVEETPMRTHPSRTVAYLLCALVSFAASTAEAEIYPSKYVTIIVSGAAGGGIDVIARIVADRLTRSWGQQVLVADRPGGGGLISAQAAAMAAPDGHTLYAAAASTFVVMPEIRTKLPFDLKHAFVPVALIGELPITIAVAPSL